MGSYAKLLIDRDTIEINISEYFEGKGIEYNIEKPKLLNQNSGQTRYTIVADNNKIELDFYFRKDNKTTIKPTGNEVSMKIGEEIAGHIKKSNECSNIKSGTVIFNNIKKEIFIELKKYMKIVPGVECLKEEIVNGCANLYQIINQTGDKITLTYYENDDKLMCQGCIYKLFFEVSSFLTGIDSKIQRRDEDKKNEKNKFNIEKSVKMLMPNAYNVINPMIQNFIYDSISLIDNGIECIDYSIYTFSALKGLEAFMKQILLKNNIRINELIGFSVRNPNRECDKKYIPIFIKKCRTYIVDIENTKIILDDQNKTALEEMYNHYNANRHRLFHTKQVINSTSIIRDKEEAKDIVYKVCNLFDKYYKLI